MRDQIIFKTSEGKEKILEKFERIIQNWPVPFKELEIPTHHGNTHVIACGSENLPPLILLHGSSTNSAIWAGDINQLSLHYHVVAVDIPGEPGKSEAIRRNLEGPEYIEWFDDLLFSLGLGKISLIGNSYGGWLALKYATAHPERIDKLVLISPSGVGPQKVSFMLKMIPLMLLGRWGRKKIIDILGGDISMPAEAIEYSILVSYNFNPRTEVFPVFTDEQLKKLTIPVLLLAGKKDSLLDTEKTAERLGKCLPALTSHVFPDKGHILVNMTDIIIDFLISERN